jgi:O-antigen/teichoic acid export membrane protein
LSNQIDDVPSSTSSRAALRTGSILAMNSMSSTRNIDQGKRAFVVVAQTAIWTTLLGFLNAKIVATRGPSVAGSLGLAAAAAGFVSFFCDLNTGQILLRIVPTDLASTNHLRAQATIQATRRITRFGAFAVIAGAALLLILKQKSGPATESLVLGVIAGAISMLALQEANILSANRRVLLRSKATFLGSIFTSALLAFSVFLLRSDSLAWTLIATAIVSLILMSFAVKTTERGKQKLTNVKSLTRVQTRILLREGLTLTAGSLAMNIAVLLVPFLLQINKGTIEVGYFRMISTLSMAYMAVFALVLTSDYLPRVSSSVSRSSENLNAQLTLFILAISPAIAIISGFSNELIRGAFSGEFLPGKSALQVYVFGDVFRLATWTITTTFLAVKGPRSVLKIEFKGAVITVLSVAIGAQALGLVGMAWGHLVGYFCFAVVAAFSAVNSKIWRPSRRLVRTFVLALVIAAGPTIAAHFVDESLVKAIAVVMALLGFGLLIRLIREAPSDTASAT